MRSTRTEPELTWPGKDQRREATDGPAPELVTSEVIGDARGDGCGRLIRGDNLDVMRALLPTFAGRVDLVYIDPPFGTGASFALTERVAGAASEVEAYGDRWDAGLGEYLSTMLERLVLMRALLSERGTIFVHCDWRVSHYLRCLLDEVFGRSCFKNEIVWRYRRWPAKMRAFQRMHDVLFWYGKTADDVHAWTPSFEPLAASTLATWGTNRQVADFSSGRRKPSQTDEPSPGAPMCDVWDIGIIAPIARERVGYPTQKPEALLRRIIEATTRPGDLVADFFAGSGTTMVVAEKLGRRWLGCDLGRAAIHASRKRLAELPSASFEVLATEALAGDTGTGPDVRVALEPRSHARSVELTLVGAGAHAVDYWAVDWDHDGQVFRHAWRTRRKHARDAVPQTARHAYAESGARRIAVLVADAGGQERRASLVWNGGGEPG